MWAFIATFIGIHTAHSFTVNVPIPPTHTPKRLGTTTTSIFMSNTLSLTLDKPLGLILEESSTNGGGVVVTAVNEGGSAYNSESKDSLIQSRINLVNGIDCSTLPFDDVMDIIINADTTVDIDFILPSPSTSEPVVVAVDEEEVVVEEKEVTPAYAVGTSVSIVVQQPQTNKGDITINAKVGDNLRKTLLSNKDIELYRGMKKKLGNCGGGGQCGFCAVELIDKEEVWGERSDYEATRIGKNGNDKCRLACMNNIVGPCTVRTL